MAEHTPGPWAHYDDRDTTQRHEIAATGKTVARIYCTNGHEEEDDANARLIAAAPELLSALEAIAQIQRDRCENARAEGWKQFSPCALHREKQV